MDNRTTEDHSADGGRAAWIRHWAVLGPKLARIRAVELRSMGPDASGVAIEALLDLASTFPPRPANSGLIDYQRRIRGKTR